MSDAPLKLEFESSLKSIIWHEISSRVDECLEFHLAHSQLLSISDPSAENLDQLRAIQAICREVKQQLSGFNEKSSYKTDLDTLSRMNTLKILLRSEE